jgi:hypothetical protein
MGLLGRGNERSPSHTLLKVLRALETALQRRLPGDRANGRLYAHAHQQC